jgi:hypothetical protein
VNDFKPFDALRPSLLRSPPPASRKAACAGEWPVDELPNVRVELRDHPSVDLEER